MKRTLLAAELADQFDVDVRTVTRWVADGCPCDGGGKGVKRLFNEGEVASWMKRKGITGATGRPADVDDSTDANDPLRKAKIRKETALADRYEIQVQRERGELVAKADVDAENVRKFNTIRNKLLGLPAAAAPIVVGMSAADAEGELESRVRLMLQELSEA